jgi:murein DD-endopeptidase MepM/ murein hydrolase activator NlpD
MLFLAVAVVVAGALLTDDRPTIGPAVAAGQASDPAPAASAAAPEATGWIVDALDATLAPSPRIGPTRPPVRARPNAVRIASSAWRWPLLGPITQRFGETLTEYGFHNGIDIDGETGDPVVAARSGRVSVAGDVDQCGGLQVQVDHGGGVISVYRHLSRIETAVGTSVGDGERIGRVGNTGCSLGSHLHFGISVDGTWVDPLRYLPAR